MKPDLQQRTLQTITLMMARRDINGASALIVGLAGGPERDARLARLMRINEACVARGRITPEEAIEREEIVQGCVREIGFDPRKWKPAQACPASTLDAQTRPELGDGGPLRFRDWRGLWREVEEGRLTESEARDIGERWTAA